MMTREEMVNIVSMKTGISLKDMKSHCREQNMVFARSLCIYFLRELFGDTFSACGKYFGRDHATALHAIRNIQQFWSFSYAKRQLIENVLTDLSESDREHIISTLGVGAEKKEEIKRVRRKIRYAEVFRTPILPKVPDGEDEVQFLISEKHDIINRIGRRYSVMTDTEIKILLSAIDDKVRMLSNSFFAPVENAFQTASV